MKRLFALVLCLCLLLCGCGEGSTLDTTGKNNGGNATIGENTDGNSTPTTGETVGSDSLFPLTTQMASQYANFYDQELNHKIALTDKGTTFVQIGKGYPGLEAAGEWTDLIGVEISVEVMYGIKRDGSLLVCCPTLIADKLNWDYSAFTNLVQVESADNHGVYGLKSDGTVVSTGDRAWDVSDWSDVIQISAGGDNTNIIMGLKADGTVLVKGYDSVLEAAQWTDIIQIYAGRFHVVGLKSDGTVVVAGHPLDAETGDVGEFDVSEWTDIVYVVAENQTTYGLKSDGTVVCTGRNAKDSYGEWTDIVCIYAGFNGLVGLRADGTLTNNSSWWIFQK